MNVLVIDVGTSSMRGILFDHQGKCLTEKQEFYQATYLENSWVEQNPADWENALYSILKKSVAEAESMGEKIEAISITSQRSSVIPVDENFRPLSSAIMWQDKRTNHICESMEDLNDKVFSLCGSRVNPVFSGSKMMWFREEDRRSIRKHIIHGNPGLSDSSHDRTCLHRLYIWKPFTSDEHPYP